MNHNVFQAEAKCTTMLTHYRVGWALLTPTCLLRSLGSGSEGACYLHYGRRWSLALKNVFSLSIYCCCVVHGMCFHVCGFSLLIHISKSDMWSYGTNGRVLINVCLAMYILWFACVYKCAAVNVLWALVGFRESRVGSEDHMKFCIAPHELFALWHMALRMKNFACLAVFSLTFFVWYQWG